MTYSFPRLPNPRLTGQAYEQLAVKFLQQHGLLLVCRNYLCKLGEIDLVMIEARQFLVFVEIRYRRNKNYGDAIATVTKGKQRKIKLAARHFLARNTSLSHYACRFDVVGLSRCQRTRQIQYDWIRHAFL